jgi:two-component system sensor histidine kinase YesM
MWDWMRSSLRRKLALAILITALIPLLLLGGFAFVISSRTTENKTKQAGLDMLRQMDANLRFMIQDVENMSIFLIGLSDVQQLISGYEDDFNVRSRVLAVATNLISFKNYISDVTIYPARSAQPLSTMSIYETDLPKLLDIRSVQTKLWTGLYPIVTYSGRSNVISFIRPLRTIGSYQTAGWLSISLDEKVISRYWSVPTLNQVQGNVALINERGDVLSSTDKSWLARPIETLLPGVTAKMISASDGTITYGEGKQKKTILYEREPLAGWTLVYMIPYPQYSTQNRYILLLTGGAIALSVLATTGMILFLIRRVTKPLSALTRLLSRLDPDEPLPMYPVDSPDEIGRLAESYNRLGTYIERLKEQLIRNETRKKEADMRALQAQINPHFLYNTLSSIHWIALMTGERRITDMVGALSDFLRFSLNKGKDYCTVQQELAHIKSYAQVQSIRYPDKFHLDILAEPAVHDEYMLKLLLQPLVENAMIHGIQKKDGKGTITVHVERKGLRLHFLVHDDGVGMSKERLRQVRNQLQLTEEQFVLEGSSYGLRNVHERLVLHYGHDSGLHIDSRLHAGTRISFSIPVMEERHENHDRG